MQHLGRLNLSMNTRSWRVRHRFLSLVKHPVARPYQPAVGIEDTLLNQYTLAAHIYRRRCPASAPSQRHPSLC